MIDDVPPPSRPDDRDEAVEILWRAMFGDGKPRGEATESLSSDIRLGHVDNRLGQVDMRLDRMETRLGQVETRLDRVEVRLERVDGRLGQVETRLAVVETKLGVVEIAIARLDTAILRLQENARTDFRLLFGAIIATAIGLAGMMAKGFHWF